MNISPYQQKLIERFGTIEWIALLNKALESPSFKKLGKGLKEARLKGATIYPESDEVFRAFALTRPKDVKVILLGQDPYYNGHADGLAFSSKKDFLPASLKQMIYAVQEDYPTSFNSTLGGSLDHWAKQGILLLNKVLSVRKGKPKSHYGKGWEEFTKEVIERLSETNDHIVFMLFGREAQDMKMYINNIDNHLIINREHPSYAARSDRKWKHEKCFFECNKFLIQANQEPIEW